MLALSFILFLIVKTAADAGKWIQYDDDNPIPQREEDITKLSGGGKTLKRENYYYYYFFCWTFAQMKGNISGR